MTRCYHKKSSSILTVYSISSWTFWSGNKHRKNKVWQTSSGWPQALQQASALVTSVWCSQAAHHQEYTTLSYWTCPSCQNLPDMTVHCKEASQVCTLAHLICNYMNFLWPAVPNQTSLHIQSNMNKTNITHFMDTNPSTNVTQTVSNSFKLLRNHERSPTS